MAPLLTAPAPGAKPAATPAKLIPFVRAAVEHEEQFDDQTQQQDASSHAKNAEIPAYGFLRTVFLLVQATGGVDSGETVALKEDGPWSSLSDIAVRDVNGAALFGPVSGYDLFLINKWGGYRHKSDPRAFVEFSTTLGSSASGNFSFGLYIPIEISLRDGLGALANQNSSSVYKLEYTVAPSSSVYSVAPDTLPSIRIRAFMEAWSQPPTVDLRGNPQATVPPANNTVQMWSKTTFNLPNGAVVARLPRVGNLIRNFIFYLNAVSDGTRASGDALWSDPIALSWDTRLLRSINTLRWKRLMVERYGYRGTVELVDGLDNAVRVYDFCHDFDGHVGSCEMRDGWLPTTGSTRLELTGTNSGAAVLTVLTNDVVPAGNVFLD